MILNEQIVNYEYDIVNKSLKLKFNKNHRYQVKLITPYS